MIKNQNKINMKAIDWNKVKKALVDTGKAEINMNMCLSLKMRGLDKKLYLDIEAKIEATNITS